MGASGWEREFSHITPPKPRCHHFRALLGEQTHTGHKLFAVMDKAIKARKVEIMLQTAATELVTNARKEVIGVRTRNQGSDLFVRARKATVVADGGFAENPEMIKQYLANAPAVVSGKITRTSHPGQTGDGIRMAMAIGADLCDMAASLATPRPFVPVHYPSIFVNSEGQRFVSETAPTPLNSAALDKQDSIAFQVFDDRVRKGASIPEARVGRLVSAPTIGDLARKLGIPAERLEYTIQTWNRYAEMGEDPEFGRQGPALSPIKTPPFWGGHLRRALNVTAGGLKTNTKSQVLDVLHGRPIPRLYAAGQTTGGRLELFYPGSGSGLAHSFVFGRIAGRNAAAEAPRE